MTSNKTKCDTSIYCITGVCGFIGRMTAYHLLQNGATVIGIDSFDRLPAELQPFKQSERLIFFPQEFHSARGAVEQILFEKPDSRKIVIHLAGIADAQACSIDPANAYYANVHLTWEVAQFCRCAGVDRCLLASTGYVYGTSIGAESSRETDLVTPDSVYTATKIAAEHLLAQQSLQQQFKSIIMRFSNVYGKGCSSKTVIGTIIDQVRQNLPVSIKDPTPVRDFIHIRDVAEAVLKLSNIPLSEQVTIVNVGTGKGTHIGTIVFLVEQMLGRMPEPQNFDPGDTLVLDPTVLQRLTCWIPQISISQGLQQLVTSKD